MSRSAPPGAMIRTPLPAPAPGWICRGVRVRNARSGLRSQGPWRTISPRVRSAPLSGSSPASRREKPSGAGLGDPALGGGEGDAVDLRHRRARVPVALLGKATVL